MPAVKVSWHQGENKPAIWTAGGIPKWNDGCLFIGDKGMILSSYSKYSCCSSEKEFVGFKRAPEPLVTARLPGHHAGEGGCRSLQERQANVGEFRVFRLADRGEPSRQRRLSHRQKTRMGRRQPARAKNVPGGRPVRIIRREYRKGWEL